jgi:leader peptidase (prepilin peptidase)/N-methyltransferase
MAIVWWGAAGIGLGIGLVWLVEQWATASGFEIASRRPARWILVAGVPVFWMLLATSGLPLVELYVPALFVTLLLLLAATDLLARRIPDWVVLPATVLAVVLPHAHSAVEAIAAGIAAAAAFYVLLVAGERLFGEGALGMGDVKLAMLIGAMFGFAGAVQALLLGMILGGVSAVALLLAGRAREETLPYGAALAVAAALVVVYVVVAR